MTKEYERVNNEFMENMKGVSDADTVLKLMELERLDRIAEALESINASLEALEPIADCVGFVPPSRYQKVGYSLFRIGRNVSTD